MNNRDYNLTIDTTSMLAEAIKATNKKMNDSNASMFNTLTGYQKGQYIADMLNKDYTQSQVGDMVGLSQSRVSQLYNQYNQSKN
jgi:hypothetical protein